MKNFAVIGNPVNHSLSPLIHHQFARQFDIELEYVKIQAREGEFRRKIDEFNSNGGSGLNVTVPYKAEAFAMSDHSTPAAQLAKAVNTLSFQDDLIVGDNTDGIGLINDLTGNHNFEITNKKILILGAGGAVSGVLGPLLEQNPATVLVANRTLKKAVELEQRFSHIGLIKGCGLDQIEPLKFDLIINGTAASLAGQKLDLSNNLLNDVELAYDMMYSDEPTIFMCWAKENGVRKVVDGLGMLVEQAAAAFEIWHQHKPQTSVVLTELRA